MWHEGVCVIGCVEMMKEIVFCVRWVYVVCDGMCEDGMEWMYIDVSECEKMCVDLAHTHSTSLQRDSATWLGCHQNVAWLPRDRSMRSLRLGRLGPRQLRTVVHCRTVSRCFHCEATSRGVCFFLSARARSKADVCV